MDVLYEEHGQAVPSGFNILKDREMEGSFTASISVSHSQLLSLFFNSAHISPRLANTQSFPKLLHSLN
jgi:hypothetical protein